MDDKLRRSMLYIPGNNPSMIQDAFIYGADVILLDLEDSITVSEKDAARTLVKNALHEVDFGRAEVAVRINPLDTSFGSKDLETIVAARPDAIRLPKVETLTQVIEVDRAMTKIEKEQGIEVGSVKLMIMIETALGVLNVHHILTGSSRIVAVNIGVEDLTADLGIKRSSDGMELLTARSLLVLAASAAQIDMTDTVYSDVDHIEGLVEEAELSKKIGFTGKSAIHPKQIGPIHQVFQPTEEEVVEAEKIIRAANQARENGIGVVTVNGKMVDLPVIRRAERLLRRARLARGGESHAKK